MAFMKRLPLSFFSRPTKTVARELLGKVLVRGRKRARIVETEAYLDGRDAASHARFGPQGRSSVMFGPPGKLYVFLVYGMHHCMNVVTERKGTAGAVLLRGAEILPLGNPNTLYGPGRLCRWLKVTRRENGLDLTDRASGLFLADDGFRPRRVGVSERIGVDYAGIWAKKKFRYYLPPDQNLRRIRSFAYKTISASHTKRNRRSN